jgi:hypothetical protein
MAQNPARARLVNLCPRVMQWYVHIQSQPILYANFYSAGRNWEKSSELSELILAAFIRSIYDLPLGVEDTLNRYHLVSFVSHCYPTVQDRPIQAPERVFS